MLVGGLAVRDGEDAVAIGAAGFAETLGTSVVSARKIVGLPVD